VHSGRAVLAASTTLAIVAGAAVAVVAWPSTPLRTDRLVGGACASYAAGDTSTSMSVTIPVQNDSADDIEVVGSRALGQVGTADVDLRVVPGRSFGFNGFGTLSQLAEGHRTVPLDGADLPAHRTSTVIATITRSDGAPFGAIGGLELDQRAVLGTIRSTVLPATLGVAAAGRIDECDLDQVSLDRD